jgi:rod shape-determining protein MreB
LLEDDNKMTVADGRNLKGGAPASISINSSQIEEVIKIYVDKILEYVTLVISKLPAEVASSVMHGGIYISGGLTKMDGIGAYISKKLSIPVNECEEPSLASVIGGGMVLSSDYLCDKIATPA